MPALDIYARTAKKPAGGPRSLITVVPNDTADLTNVIHWLHVSIGGSLRVTSAGGETVTFANILPGWHALEIARVHSTGTTATGLVGGW